jgi:hypothetical protein
LVRFDIHLCILHFVVNHCKAFGDFTRQLSFVLDKAEEIKKKICTYHTLPDKERFEYLQNWLKASPQFPPEPQSHVHSKPKHSLNNEQSFPIEEN